MLHNKILIHLSDLIYQMQFSGILFCVSKLYSAEYKIGILYELNVNFDIKNYTETKNTNLALLRLIFWCLASEVCYYDYTARKIQHKILLILLSVDFIMTGDWDEIFNCDFNSGFVFISPVINFSSVKYCWNFAKK